MVPVQLSRAVAVPISATISGTAGATRLWAAPYAARWATEVVLGAVLGVCRTAHRSSVDRAVAGNAVTRGFAGEGKGRKGF